MATKNNSRADEEKARNRYVDQVGQWRNVTPADVKKKQAAAWNKLEKSLTPAQRKQLGIKKKGKK